VFRAACFIFKAGALRENRNVWRRAVWVGGLAGHKKRPVWEPAEGDIPVEERRSGVVRDPPAVALGMLEIKSALPSEATHFVEVFLVDGEPFIPD
jgi:hypothetical protein